MTAEKIYAIKPNEFGWRVLPNLDCVKLGKNVRLGNDVKLDNYVTLGNDVTLGTGATLGNYVRLGDDVKLGNYVTLGDYVTLGAGMLIEKPAVEVRVDWGLMVAGKHKDGGWRVSVGCRCFTYQQAVKHWSGQKDREITMRALEYCRAEAVARGWEKKGR